MRHKRNYKKPLLYIVSAVVTGVLSVTSIASVTAVASAASVAQAEEAEVIRVGYPDDAAIIREYADGSYYGYAVEYLEKIAEYTDWEYEYVQSSFSELCDMLEKGELDFVCVMQKTPEREEKYLFSDYYAGWEYNSLYVQPDKNIDFEEFEAFEGLRIGFIKDALANEDFERYAKEHEFDYQAYYYETSEDMDAAFAAGELDAITRNNIRMNTGLRSIAKFSADPYYFAADLQNEELMEEMNRALEKIKLENGSYLEDLQEKYAAEGRETTLTLAEREFIESLPTIRVAYCDNYGPVAYEQDGQLMGISAEMFERITEETGISFEFKEYINMEAARRAFVNGKADLLAAVESRTIQEESMSVTEPYFEDSLVMVAQDMTDMNGTIRIALRGADEKLERYIAATFEEYQLVCCSMPEECLNAVLTGDAEFAFESSFLVSEAMSQAEYDALYVNVISDYNTQICIGVNGEQNPLLVQILNKCIRGVTNSERTQMVAQALAKKRTDMSFAEYLKRNIDKITIVILCIIVIILVVRATAKRKRQHELEQIAYYDDMTGLRKQEKFLIDMQKILKTNPDKKYALVYTDLERFRYLNSVLGRLKSNELIKLYAGLLNDSLNPGELSGRLYADDFMLLYEYQDKEPLMERLKLVQLELQAKAAELEIGYKIAIHAGVYLIENKDEKDDEIIYRAVLAKQMSQSGDEIYFFDEYLEKKLHTELKIESIMEEALYQEEFKPFFQPKYSTDGEEIVGAEALVRWIRPDGSMVYPNDFIPLFEKNGFILQLDYYMYRKVLQWLRSQIDNNLPTVRISVNLSRLHNGDVHMGKRLSEMAERYRVPPQLIEFELTESAFTDNADNILEQLRILREKGFAISIDDFGSGYSSLNLLRSVPADILKIDKGFLDESEDSEKSSHIIRDIVTMAKNINMEVICEGVETAEQLKFLKGIQCDYAQGYYFAKPLPVQDFEKVLAERK